MVFSGAALPAAHCCLKVGPLGPADGAAERAELGCGAPGATYSSKNGPSPLKDIVWTVTIVSHRPRFSRQTFELDSGDPSETFALLLRGRAEILKRSSLIKRNSADFGVIGGLSAVITVITVTFAIER